MLFELCIKIAESDRFINWIGNGLDKSIRYLIMFVISLNATISLLELLFKLSKVKLYERKKKKVFFDGSCKVCSKEINFTINMIKTINLIGLI